jgi:hypothetical protein
MQQCRRVALVCLCVLPVLVLACAKKAPATGAQTSPTGTPAPTASSSASGSGPGPTGAPSPLWYLVRGGSKLDQGWGVDVDAEGNVYFAAYQQAASELFTDIVVYELRPDGTEVWRTRWGGRWQEKAFVVVVSGSYVYVGGCVYGSASLTDADMLILALNRSDGSVAWDFSWGQGYGYEEADGLVVEADAIYVSGWTTSKSTGNDIGLLKLDLHGKLVWARSWGGQGWDEGDGQMVVDADAIYVAGRYDGTNMALGGRGLLARFDKATGDYVSHVTWGGPLGTDAMGLTSDGTYLYAVGITVDRGHGSQIQIRKCGKSLDLVWERLWGGEGREDTRVAAIGPGGDVFVAGASNSHVDAGEMDAVLLRYHPNGDLVWAKTWGGSKAEGIHGLAIGGGRAYLAGNSKSYGSGQDDAILIAANADTGEFPDQAARK